jgi:hypothetical protein
MLEAMAKQSILSERARLGPRDLTTRSGPPLLSRAPEADRQQRAERLALTRVDPLFTTRRRSRSRSSSKALHHHSSRLETERRQRPFSCRFAAIFYSKFNY